MTTNGYTVTIDAEDWDKVKDKSWIMTKKGDINIGIVNSSRKFRTIRLSRFLVPPPKKLQNFYKNGNLLDNRKSNIGFKISSGGRNRKTGKSGYIGVYKKTNDKCYNVQVRHKNNTRFYMGGFNTAEEAAKAYDKKSFELHGKDAALNFPEEHK